MSTVPPDREVRSPERVQVGIVTAATIDVRASDLSAALPGCDGFERLGADAA